MKIKMEISPEFLLGKFACQKFGLMNDDGVRAVSIPLNIERVKAHIKGEEKVCSYLGDKPKFFLIKVSKEDGEETLRNVVKYTSKVGFSFIEEVGKDYKVWTLLDTPLLMDGICLLIRGIQKETEKRFRSFPMLPNSKKNQFTAVLLPGYAMKEDNIKFWII